MAERERSPEDLTARARIRDAALEQIAELGERGATIRGIAKAAGVSPALVQHHYGTKEALRKACDEYVIQTLVDTKREALAGGMGNSGFLSVAMRTARPVQRYLARVLGDDSPAARTLFDDAVAFSEDILSRGAPGMSRPRTDDLPGYAAVLTAMSFGVIVLHDHLSRSLGGDILLGPGHPRMVLAMMDILDDRLLSPELIAQARDAIKSLPADGEQPHDEEKR